MPRVVRTTELRCPSCGASATLLSLACGCELPTQGVHGSNCEQPAFFEELLRYCGGNLCVAGIIGPY